MLLFGHLGCTLLAVRLAEKAIFRPLILERRKALNISPGSASNSIEAATMSKDIDYRWILLGSLLSDIIDKPLSFLIPWQNFTSGRAIGHTLLFTGVLILVGLLLSLAKGRTWMLFLGIGTGLHLVFDEMWRNPNTLFWPFYSGFLFGKANPAPFVPRMLEALSTSPKTYIPEVIGAIVIVFAFAELLIKRRLRSFIYRGSFR